MFRKLSADELRKQVVSSFGGINVDMDYCLCIPSVHATYQGEEIIISIGGSIREVSDDFPRNIAEILTQWVLKHEQEILQNHGKINSLDKNLIIIPPPDEFYSDDGQVKDLFPDELDGAKVLFHTSIGDYGPQHHRYLAVCKYEKSNEYYLFDCDKDYEVVNDTIWESAEECMDVAESSFGKEIEWKEKLHEKDGATIPRSIHNYIVEHIKDSQLPEGFHIPWINSIWAPGAQDGVFLYHMARLVPDDKRAEKILKALKLLADDKITEPPITALGIFEKLNKETSMVRLYNEITQLIISNKDNLNRMKLLHSGIQLAIKGSSFLSVKLGLTIISIFKAPAVINIMLTLGLYDEFTYFAARALSRKIFPTGNQSLFFLAKNTYGWGRIHAVNYLQPEDQAVSDWILYEGAENRIDPQYSADTCLQKSKALTRLMDVENISSKEYQAIGKLIQCALKDGPCPGLTDEELTAFYYLSNAQKFHADGELVQKLQQVLQSHFKNKK